MSRLLEIATTRMPATIVSERRGRVIFSLSASFVALVALLLLVCPAADAELEEQSKYFLPRDKTYFSESDFISAYQAAKPYQILELRKSIWIGDLEFRAAWGGTHRKLRVDPEISIGFSMVNREVPDNKHHHTVRLSFRGGLAVAGSMVGIPGWNRLHLIRASERGKPRSRAYPLDGGGAIYFFIPQMIDERREGVALICMQPHYRRLVFSRKRKEPRIETNWEMSLDSLGINFSYEMESSYISGVMPVKADIGVFVDPRYSKHPVDFDEVFIRNPTVGIFGSFQGKAPLSLKESSFSSAEILGKASYDIGKGRKGVFLTHRRIEIHPASKEMYDLVGAELGGQKNKPYYGYSQCFSLASYEVKRDIYETHPYQADPTRKESFLQHSLP